MQNTAPSITNWHGLNLRGLRHFAAVTGHLNFSRAAASLHLTQPALSRSIARLEADLGLPLFDRAAGGIALTQFGERVLERTQLLLNEYEHMHAAISAARGGAEGHVSVGVTPGLQSHVLAHATARLLEAAPRVRVRVATGLSRGNLSTQLKGGAVDLVLGPILETPESEDIAQEVLFSDDVCAVARRGHPILRSRADLRRLARAAWVLFAPEVLSRQHLAGVFTSAGLTPPAPCVECDSTEFSRSLVLESDLIGYLPRRVYDADARRGRIVELRAPALRWRQSVGISYRRRSSLSPGATALMAQIRAAGAAFALSRVETAP